MNEFEILQIESVPRNSAKLQGTATAFNIRAVDCFCGNYYTCRLKILAATKCSANYNLDIESSIKWQVIL